jgi:2-phospho-L-lactate/phosphoenolpyruvate guanylyltransferase
MTVDARWSVLLPVKVLARAKSRLADLAGPRRGELALALACDTVTAVLDCEAAGRVVVITDDRVVAAALRELGALVIPDEPRDGLNAALRHGAALAELARALSAAAAWPTAFVADAAGDGTTLYTAAPGAAFRPAFGSSSRARHGAGGAAELEPGDIPGLRRDVDTPADLRGAAALGLGPYTAPLAAELLRCAPQGR